MNLLSLIKKHSGLLSVLFILVLAVVCHKTVFLGDSVLSSGDWSYLHKNSSDEYLAIVPGWRTYPNGFGAANLNAVFYPTNLLLGFFLQKFGFALMERIVYFIPMLLASALGMYFLARHVVKNNTGALLASIMYAYNSYFVVTSASHPTISNSYAFAPFVFLFFFKFYQEKGYLNGVLALLFSFIMMGYEFRIFYLIALTLFFYVLILCIKALLEHKSVEFWTYIRKSIFFIVFFVGLSMYWVLGTFKMGVGLDNPVFNRGLWGSQYYDIFHALAFHYSFWNPDSFTPFENVPVPLTYFIFPVLFITSFFIKKKNKEVLFFSILGLVGILLTKQESPPFNHIYIFLFEHFPGFKAFREASKFYVYTSLSYSILSGFFVAWLFQLETRKNIHKATKYGIFVVIFLVSCVNVVPLFYNRTERNFVPRQIPPEYITLKDSLLDSSSYSRILWLPRNSRWAFWNLQHPRLSMIDLMNAEWRHYFDLDANKSALSIEQKIMNIFNKPFSEQLFDNSAIQYVVVPLQSIEPNDDLFLPYGGRSNKNIRQWYIEQLSKVSWLQRMKGDFGELAVFENKNYRPHIYASTGWNYTFAHASEFGFFEEKDNLYLNSKVLDVHTDFLDSVNTLTLPVEPDQQKLQDMLQAITNEKDARKKKQLKADYDQYLSGYFFKDFVLKVPKKAIYTLYFKNGSILAKDGNIQIKMFDTVLEKKYGAFIQTVPHAGWLPFNQVELDKGDYTLELFSKGERVNAINPQDIVFAAMNVLPSIASPTIEYQRINPTQYVVNVSGAHNSFPLVFSEAYDSGWKLFFGTSPTKTTLFDVFSQVPSLDENHLIINNFANGWWVDVDTLLREGKIQKNEDGTFDFSLTIEFEPQKYFILGFFISAGTFALCILYLLYKCLFWLYTRLRR